ncbi:MAG: M48 family metallopeptidase [Chloroflexi bacterium]|nr:M48 family metallopeptidase [Chloroflexota bacterium]
MPITRSDARASPISLRGHRPSSFGAVSTKPRSPRSPGNLWIARLPPLVLALLGLALAAWLVTALIQPGDGQAAPWWAFVIGLLPAAILALSAAALVVDPRPLAVRRWAAGAGLAVLVLLSTVALFRLTETWFDAAAGPLLLVAALDAAALLALAATTPAMVDDDLPDMVGRLAAAAAVAGAILGATLTIALAIRVVVAVVQLFANASAAARIPWGFVLVIALLSVVTFTIAALDSRRAARGTFFAQAAANRRNSVLLLITLVGIVAATAEIIAVSLTLRPVPALWAALIAAGAGVGAAILAHRSGADIILESAGARPADRERHAILLNVVQELALAAGIPTPRTYVIEDRSINAFATGRDPGHAAVVVTSGLLERLDREQLQGVIGHELAHVRNLDTRYALYVAILVGLIVIVTDGFLRLVVELWQRGAFIWSSGDDPRSAVASFVAGLAVGLFLLLVAALLHLAAPFFSLLVKTAVNRQREFLADATSVELTRNPIALERALAEIADDRVALHAANRGTQHLWLRNPLSSDGGGLLGLLATHPPLEARIERLRRLRGMAKADTGAAAEAVE